jgi:L-ascorbate metabolism protein UlaG (beta-lactamase superfamily)
MSERRSLSWLGHSTVLIELDGHRLLTDPVLRRRLLHLRRLGPVPPPERLQGIDSVLVSHLHPDHLDPPSLRRLGGTPRVVGPPGSRRLLPRELAQRAEELKPGEGIRLGEVKLRAVPASHDIRRHPLARRGGAIGFVIEGSLSLYFAGDTDLFDEMSEIGPVDVALLPVWGWGPRAGSGHLDPARALEALRRIRPRICVPIHWGTFVPFHMQRRRPRWLTDPPLELKRLAADALPDVEIRPLEPLERLPLG